MNKIYILLGAVFLSVLILFSSCKEDVHTPINKDGSAPDPVREVQVENMPGAAKISYDLPDSKNLLYVKAVYEIGEKQKEVRASYYKNELMVEGFPDTTRHEVRLYAVSRGEKESEPVRVDIQPLTPPLIQVFNSLEMKATFGGVRVMFKNESEAEVVISVLAADSLGDLVDADRFYTEIPEGSFAVRGFSPEKRKFGIYVRDRWNNRSDTLFSELIPLFEELIPKAGFREMDLPTDTNVQHCCGGGLFNLWDGIWNVGSPVFHTKPGTPIPQWFTFDMGVKAQLSRFKFYHRRGRNDGAYTIADPQIFEVWGSNDPNPDGSWDSWMKLGDFRSIKPSGEDEPKTNEDIQYAVVNGEDFEFPDAAEAPAVRYLRFKILRTWGGVEAGIHMAELTFWGEIQEETAQ